MAESPSQAGSENGLPPPGRWLNRNVWGMGLTSLLCDAGHEMATAVLPGFLAVIGAPVYSLGIIEGTADALSSFVKLGAGWWIDRLGHRKAITTAGYALTGGALAFVLLILVLFSKELLFVSFDRAMAATLGKNVLFWDALLYLLIGFTVSIAVLSVGPLISFGFLLIPALTAHLFARNIKWFILLASLIGGVSSFLGFWLAYQWDWPVGPTDVVLLGLIYALASAVRWLMQLAAKAR